MTLIKHIDFEIPEWAEFQQGPQTYTAPIPQTDPYRDLVLATAPDSLVGYYRNPSGTTLHNATPADTSGSFGDAALKPGSPLWTGGSIITPGLVTASSAAQFGGTTGYADIADSASLSTTSGMTIAAWVKPDTLDHPTNRAILCREGPYFGDSGIVHWLLYFPANDRRPGFLWDSASGGARIVYAPAITTTERLFIAVTYAAGVASIYANGALAGTVGTTVLDASTTDPLRIGAIDSSEGFFPGIIDEVAIWDTGLSAPQINTLYQQGATT